MLPIKNLIIKFVKNKLKGTGKKHLKKSGNYIVIFVGVGFIVFSFFSFISVVGGGATIDGVAMSGKIQLEEMTEEEQAELEKKVGKWLSPYGNYMADPPTTNKNTSLESDLNSISVDDVAVDMPYQYISSLNMIGNPIVFLSQQNVSLSFGLIKSLEVVAGIDPDESIPLLEPKNLEFKKQDITVSAKVITKYEPQDPYFRLKDEKGNPKTTKYVVKEGETLESIAKTYETTSEDIIVKNKLRTYNEVHDEEGKVVTDEKGEPVKVEVINFHSGMTLTLDGEIYTPPDKAIYKTKEFNYTIEVVSSIETYNGKYVFNYESKTESSNLTTVNSPENQDREVNDDGQEETLTITYPTFSSYDYTEDYSPIDNLLIDYGFYDEEDQIIIYRQAIAYDPLFTDKKANSLLATELMEELSELDPTLVSVNEISGAFCGQVPAEYYQIYQDASNAYNVPWVVLASIHQVETNYGQANPMISSAGAIGHTQFMPSTWLGWSYPNHDSKGNITDGTDITDLELIAKYGGYGVDADGDGIADPMNATDAIHATAKYISANGGEGDLYNAIYAYNHADWYVNKVLRIAQQIASGENTCSEDGTAPIQVDNETIQKAINYGYTLFGKSKYGWGAGRTASDRSQGIFDCSSFVWYAYFQAGVDLSPNGCTENGYCNVSTQTLRTLGTKVTLEDAQVGDLIFFNTTGVADSHVGIYIGNNEFIHAGTSTGVTKASLNNYWKPVFENNGSHIRRVIQ